MEAKLAYRGKHFTVPSFSGRGFEVVPGKGAFDHSYIPADHPILKDLNTTFNKDRFKEKRTPISLGTVPKEEQEMMSKWGLPRILDMPIKFPGSHFRVPEELSQLRPIIQRVANAEATINAKCYDEYYCYITVDQGVLEPGKLQREAPCHVDGFQGARWTPKTKINHTYVITDTLPTTYYAQPFDFSELDERKHNFFWEMNYQVAQTKSAHAYVPEPYELLMMDAYTVHRGSPAHSRTRRLFLRFSFEVRKFDRLGNAHNPLFSYKWKMQKRDIEGLNLVAFHPDCDASLRVFPWQKEDGTRWENPTQRTQPKLQ